MKTSIVLRRIRAVSLATLAVAAIAPCHAIGGVGDVVIIAADQMDGVKWTREKTEWEEVQTLLRKELEQTKLLVERMGNPGAPASVVAGDVARVTEPAEAAVALQSRQESMRQGLRDYAVGADKTAPLSKVNAVDSSYQVLGDQYSRNSARFASLAREEGLLERRMQALENQGVVAQKEMETQKRLLERLKRATTQTEIEAVDAAIAASQQRLEVTRQMSEQARGDGESLGARLRIETERKREADLEWADTFVEKLRARALTSLHAQQGENH